MDDECELECLICANGIDSEIVCARRASSIPIPEVVRLPCRCREGYYHRECLVRCWKERNPTRCPLCRTGLLSIEGCMQNEGFVAAVFDTLGSWVPDVERIPDATTAENSVGKVYQTSSPRADVLRSWCVFPDVETSLDDCDLLTAVGRDGRGDLLEMAGSSHPACCPLFKDMWAWCFVMTGIFLHAFKTKRPVDLHPSLATAETADIFTGARSWLDLMPHGSQIFAPRQSNFLLGDKISDSTSAWVSFLLSAKCDPFQNHPVLGVPFVAALDYGRANHLFEILFSKYKEYEADCQAHVVTERSVIWPDDSRPIQVDLTPGKCPMSHVVFTAVHRTYYRYYHRSSRRDVGASYDIGWSQLARSVHFLILAGASVDEADETGWWTPLLYAVRIGNLSVVKMLLWHGADPGAKAPSSFWPIHEAARCGFTDIARALLFGVQASGFEQAQSADLYQSSMGRLRDATIQLDINTTPNRRSSTFLKPQLEALDGSGRTAIWHAANNAWDETLRFLLVSLHDLHDGRVPLHSLQDLHDPACPSFLTRFGFSGIFREIRDRPDADGVTALQAAKLRLETGFVSRSAAECVWLLERNAFLLTWGWDSWDKDNTVGGIVIVAPMIHGCHKAHEDSYCLGFGSDLVVVRICYVAKMRLLLFRHEDLHPGEGVVVRSTDGP